MAVSDGPPFGRAVLLVALAVFIVVATANAGMYRYGVSDQAFYIPAVTRALDASAFPRDGALIDAQGRLMLADEVLALLVRTTGASLETLFFAGYLLSLALIFAGLAGIGRRLYANPWTTYALIAAFTLRHQITRTSANSFEPYFHPRMLAFGVGVIAVAAYLHRRSTLAVLLVALTAAIHTTTGLWFAGLVGIALTITDRWWRRLAIPAALAAVAVGGWALAAGPLRDRLVVMDSIWLQAVAAKDTLFANQWPLSAWAANLGTLGLLWLAYRFRARHGRATAEERGLAWGATALVALFLITLPAVAAHIALPVQLQMSRVFWLVDLVATVLLVGAVADSAWFVRLGPPAFAACALALAAGRGGYILFHEHAERPLFSLHLADTPWHQAMRFVASLPKDAHILADSGHAWRYGTSVRVSGGRDVYLEETKDAAVAIYSRDVAARVVDRIRSLGDLSQRTPEEIDRIAAQYGITHVVTERPLPLPPVFENARFHVYALPPPIRFADRTR